MLLEDEIHKRDLPPPPPGHAVWPWLGDPQARQASMAGRREEWPKITLVTPNYNYARFLEATIRSVLLQGYPNLEYIIIDDGSTDHSVEIIKKYAPWISSWKTRPNRGQTQTINEGFKMATGEIINWLNSDDYLAPGALFKVGEFFRNNPRRVVCFGRSKSIDRGGYMPTIAKASEPFTREELIMRWNKMYVEKDLIQPATFVRREVLDEIGYLNESYQLCMDYEWYLNINRKHDFCYLNELLSCHRYHPDCKTVKYQREQYRESIRASRKFWKERPVYYLLAYYWHNLKFIPRKVRRFIENHMLKGSAE